MKKLLSLALIPLLVIPLLIFANAAVLIGKCDETVCTIETADMLLDQKDIIPYSPMTLTVRPGANVTFVSKGTDGHTATSGISPRPDKRFDTGLLSPGKQLTVTIGDAGEYAYFCIIHPWMNGTIIAAGEPIPRKPAAQPAPVPQPAPQPAPAPQPVIQPPQVQQPQPPAPAPLPIPPPQPIQPQAPQPISQPAQQPAVQAPQQEAPAAVQEPPKPVEQPRPEQSALQKQEPEVAARTATAQADNPLIIGGIVALGAITVIAVAFLRKKA